MRLPNKTEWAGAGRWLKNDLAEWVIGSWALLIGWGIVGTIFYNLLQMDGHFSRGLGEGSGIDPSLFQNIGWMYGGFAAVFLVLCVKFEAAGLKATAISIKALGVVCIGIVMMHAVGFGLKALEAKRAGAAAVEDVAVVETTTNTNSIQQLRDQVSAIDTQLAVALAPINKEIATLDDDGNADNDKRSDDLRARRTLLEDEARAEKRKLNDDVATLIKTGGSTKAASTKDIATTEKWAPLFVGLAQFFNWTKEPTDWQIYIAGVLFNIAWMLFAHMIVIVMPPAMYKLHLKDAKPRAVKVNPDVFADLLAQADELAKRKANLSGGAEKGIKTKTRTKRVRLAIEDMRAERVKREELQKAVDAEAALDQGGEFEAPEQTEPEEPELELVDVAAADEAETAENDDAPDQQEKAA